MKCKSCRYLGILYADQISEYMVETVSLCNHPEVTEDLDEMDISSGQPEWCPYIIRKRKLEKLDSL